MEGEGSPTGVRLGWEAARGDVSVQKGGVEGQWGAREEGDCRRKGNGGVWGSGEERSEGVQGWWVSGLGVPERG